MCYLCIVVNRAAPTQRNTAIVLPFSFLGRTGLASLPRGLGGGRKKAEAPAHTKQPKKNKKKYAIRDSNPENLLGRQKCYPYTNGVENSSVGARVYRCCQTDFGLFFLFINEQ